MEIPTIKTLLTYRHYPEKKTVLCDYLIKGDSKYSAIELEQAIHSRNPFEFDDDNSEIYHRDADGSYAITYYENGKQIRLIDAFVTHVLEFKGNIFELKETSYDMKEYDF
jgi:hypothetical protein